MPPYLELPYGMLIWSVAQYLLLYSGAAITPLNVKGFNYLPEFLIWLTGKKQTNKQKPARGLFVVQKVATPDFQIPSLSTGMALHKMPNVLFYKMKLGMGNNLTGFYTFQ